MVREGSAKDGAGVGRTPFGINLAVGAVTMVAATSVAAAMFPVAEVPARLVVIALAVGAYAALVPDTRASLTVAGLAYPLFNGFLLNRYGELTWDGTKNIWHLILFAIAVGLGLGQRWIRHVRARAALADELDDGFDTSISTKKESHGA